MKNSTRLNDSGRLHALAETALMDSPSEEAFDRLTRLACRVLQVPVVLISLVDENRQFFKSAVGLEEPWATARETPLTHSFCQHVVRSEDAILVENAYTDELVHGNLAISELGVVSYAGVPIRAPDGQVLGSFCAIDHQPRTWQENDLLLLNDLSAAITTEIELRAAVQEALHLATHDPLSGLANRTYFLERLDVALENAGREGENVALLFLDLDNFKVINDGMGHLSGDHLLVEVAHRLRTCVRINDVVSRFGGDEFTILINGLPEGSENNILNRVMNDIKRQMRIPFLLDGKSVSLSFSIGYALSIGGSVGSEELLRNADRAMYQVKQEAKQQDPPDSVSRRTTDKTRSGIA